MANLVGIGVAGLLIFAMAYMWGRAKGKQMEAEVIKNAFINAGLAEEKFDKVMSEPLNPSNDLFDDWV